MSREVKFRVWDSTPHYEFMSASVTLADIGGVQIVPPLMHDAHTDDEKDA